MKENINDVDNDVNKAPEITVKIKSYWYGEYEVKIVSNASLKDLLISSGHEHVLKFIDYKRELYCNLDDTLNKFNISDGAEIQVNQIVYTDGRMGLFVMNNNYKSDNYLYVTFPLQEIYKQITNWCKVVSSCVSSWIIIDDFGGQGETKLKQISNTEGLSYPYPYEFNLENLFLDLDKKNKFKNDVSLAVAIDNFEYSENKNLPGNIPPNVQDHLSNFTEMTNRQFLKQAIKNYADRLDIVLGKPRWKRILFFIEIFFGRHWFVDDLIFRYPKLRRFFGALNICAYAGLIYSLVFNLSLAVFIPSVIILALLTICNLVAVFIYRCCMYQDRKIYSQHIDNFFEHVDSIQNYLDTFDLPPKDSKITEHYKNGPNNNETMDVPATSPNNSDINLD